MNKTEDISNRGWVKPTPQLYGRSNLGAPLEAWVDPKATSVELLLFAGIHGNEPEGTMLLSKLLRTFQRVPQKCAIILAANPDGISRGTRANANGVDLNRNFAAQNWSPKELYYHWNRDTEEREMILKTGEKPGSEPETQALAKLISTLKPKHTIAVHGPLDCVDDPESSVLGKWLSEKSNMPLVEDIGYPVPGSFGSWCKEQNYHVITYELPNQSSWEIMQVHLPIFEELLHRYTE